MMNLYLDENLMEQQLLDRLRKAGHRVVTPAEVELLGASDARQLTHAVVHDHVVLTSNRGDFYDLHELVQTTGGKHSGILVACYDNDPPRDLTPRGMVTAIAKLESSGVPIDNQIYVLNHWR